MPPIFKMVPLVCRIDEPSVLFLSKSAHSFHISTGLIHVCNDAEQYTISDGNLHWLRCMSLHVISSRQSKQIQQGSRTLQLTTVSKFADLFQRNDITSGARNCWCVSAGEVIPAAMFGSKGHRSKSAWCIAWIVWTTPKCFQSCSVRLWEH